MIADRVTLRHSHGRHDQQACQVRLTRQESRDRIVAAATELVRTPPYAELSVDEVMREAGLGRTIFYRHFDDLADLLCAPVARRSRALRGPARRWPARAPATSRTSIRQAIEPRRRVYQRHGPLLRAVTEAAAGDEQIAAGTQRCARASTSSSRPSLRRCPARGAPPRRPRRDRRALNLMNEAYLLDAFGREPRVSAETAVQTLTEIWDCADPPSTGHRLMDVFRTPDERFDRPAGLSPTSRTTSRSTGCGSTTSTRAAGRHGALLPRRAELELPLPPHARAAWWRAGTGSSAPTSSGSAARTSPPTRAGTRTTATSRRSARTSTSSTSRRHRRRPGLGRPDRPALGRRERRPGRPAGDPQHRPVHRPREQGLHGLARVRRAARPTCRSGRSSRAATTTDLARRGRRRLRGAVPQPGEQGRRAAFPLLVPLDEEDPGAAEMARRPRGARRLGQAGPGGVLRQRPVFPFPRAGEQFTDLMPTAGEQVRIEGAAHFLQEDRGAEIAEAMRDGRRAQRAAVPERSRAWPAPPPTRS